MKCVIDAKIWKAVAMTMAMMRDEAAFKFEKDGLDIKQMDVSHTVMIHLRLPVSIWKGYTPVDFPIVLDVQEMKKYLRSLKSAQTITLSAELDSESRLNMGVKGRYGFRRFGLAVMEVEEDNKDPPTPKKFVSDVKAKVAVQALVEAVNDAETVVGDSGRLMFDGRSNPERLVVWAAEEGTFRSSWYEFYANQSLLEMECSGDKVRAGYGVPQMKVILSGAAFSNIVKVEYAEDFPVKFTYQLAFPGELWFMTAPRITVK